MKVGGRVYHYGAIPRASGQPAQHVPTIIPKGMSNRMTHLALSVQIPALPARFLRLQNLCQQFWPQDSTKIRTKRRFTLNSRRILTCCVIAGRLRSTRYFLRISKLQHRSLRQAKRPCFWFKPMTTALPFVLRYLRLSLCHKFLRELGPLSRTTPIR
jgi:hypothetical protein